MKSHKLPLNTGRVFIHKARLLGQGRQLQVRLFVVADALSLALLQLSQSCLRRLDSGLVLLLLLLRLPYFPENSFAAVVNVRKLLLDFRKFLSKSGIALNNLIQSCFRLIGIHLRRILLQIQPL